jgi:hypothetical protein
MTKSLPAGRHGVGLRESRLNAPLACLPCTMLGSVPAGRQGRGTSLAPGELFDLLLSILPFRASYL